MKVFLINKILLLLLLVSCSANYDCDELSMKRYKGIPAASAKFDKNCLTQKVKYTSELCQKALVDLIILKKRTKLENKYGSRVMECFTSSDIKRFIK